MNLNTWILASRPKTLWAGIAPVIIGTALAYADGMVHWPSALLAMLGAILIQIGTNFANDYYDFQKGADNENRKGPLRITQAGLVSSEVMKRAVIITFTLAFISGLYLIFRGGWPILLLGCLSILFGILYTGGPYPLGYNGLGELFVFLFFGIGAVSGTYYVQTLTLTNEVLVAGIAPGLFSSAILAVNNLRDIEEDITAGKRTLTVRLGKRFTQFEYLFCVLYACLVPISLVLMTQCHMYSLAALTVLFASIPAVKTVFSKSNSEKLNVVLAQTGILLLIYSIIFSIGWVI